VSILGPLGGERATCRVGFISVLRRVHPQ
jgi:hypothetical protein